MFTPIYEQVKAKFNPDAQVGYRLILELRTELYYVVASNKESTETRNADKAFDEKEIEFGLNLQKKLEMSKGNAKLKIIGVFYQTSAETLENMGYDEVEALWEDLETKKPSIISFLKLS